MNLLLVVDDYLPGSIKIAAKMMHDLALELIEQGNDVTVCTPDTEMTNSTSIEYLEGVRVLRFKSGSIKNVSKVKRAINESLLSYVAWKRLKSYFRENRCDKIVYYSPSIFFGPLVNKLKNLWKCESFLILRDIFPQWAVDNGLIRNGSLIHRYFKYFESINYDAATIIAVQSPSNKQYFQNNLRYKNKLDVLYNWSAITKEKAGREIYRNKLGLTNKVVLFYGGNIGHAQDMMNIIRLAKSLESYSTAHFLLVGKGDEVDLVNREIVENKLTNVTYLPPVDQKEYQKMLAEFDIGLFSLHKDHKTHNFPGKLLGYMKNSLPILGSVNINNDLELVLTEANAGLVSVNGDDHKFFINAKNLVNSEELRTKLGKNSLNLLSDKFSVKTAVNKILYS